MTTTTSPATPISVALSKTPRPGGRDILVGDIALDWFEAGQLADAIQEVRRQHQIRQSKSLKKYRLRREPG